MAKRKEREQAFILRKRGMSYSQIGQLLGVGKSTLSGWLSEFPLSRARINELRATSELRIEKYRASMHRKREERSLVAFRKVSRDIETSLDAEFVAGFHLYWGEGTKTAPYTVSLANSDPSLVACFVRWLVTLGVARTHLRAKLHVYSDQNVGQLTEFWCRALDIPRDNFTKPYLKQTRLDRKTYKGMFPYGTCTVAYHDRDMHQYVLSGVRYLREKHLPAIVAEKDTV